jgi:hypothetical protein
VSDRAPRERVRVEHWRDGRPGLARPLDTHARLVVGRLDADDEVCEQLFGVAWAQGVTPQRQGVVPGDGAKGLREAVLVTFPQAQALLAWPHLTSQLYDTATALELEGPARHAWVSEHLDRCWAGEVDQGFATWQQQRQADAPNERLRQLIDHGTRCADGVDDGASHERGWPLGAGEVERAHRSVSQERLKIAGACWNPENVNPMVARRVVRTNGWWEDFWPWRLDRKQAQVGMGELPKIVEHTPMALFPVAHQPAQRQGATFRDHMDHQGDAATPHCTAIDHQHQRLQGPTPQQDVGIGQKISLLADAIVADPPRESFHAALGFGAIGDLRGDFGELRALRGDHPTDQGGQGGEMSGPIPSGLARIPWCEGLAYGTISTKVVTHRIRLLV